jgi:hypothetical protein
MVGCILCRFHDNSQHQKATLELLEIPDLLPSNEIFAIPEHA